MKKIAYIFCVLAAMLQGCSKDDNLQLESRTKELEEAETGGNPRALECKKALVAATDGWKMVYQPLQGGESYTFFFRFQNDGLVETESDFPEKSIYALFELGGNTEKLTLQLKGGAGHLRFLPQNVFEEEMVVKEVTADKITGVGAAHGFTMTLVKASAGEIAAVTAQKKLYVALQDKNLIRGTVRNGAQFVAHYIVNPKDATVNFTFIKDGLVRHESRVLASSANAFSWDAVALENGVTLTGLEVASASNAITLKGAAASSLVLTNNSSVVSEFDNRNRQYQISAKYGIGAAKADLWSETGWSKLELIELNFQWGTRPLVAILNGGFLFYDVVGVDNAPLKGEKDKVIFENANGRPLFGGTTEQFEEAKTALGKVFAAYFHPDGFYVVKEEEESGDIYYYLLSTTTDSWFKVKQSK